MPVKLNADEKILRTNLRSAIEDAYNRVQRLSKEEMSEQGISLLEHRFAVLSLNRLRGTFSLKEFTKDLQTTTFFRKEEVTRELAAILAKEKIEMLSLCLAQPLDELKQKLLVAGRPCPLALLQCYNAYHKPRALPRQSWASCLTMGSQQATA